MFTSFKAALATATQLRLHRHTRPTCQGQTIHSFAQFCPVLPLPQQLKSVMSRTSPLCCTLLHPLLTPHLVVSGRDSVSGVRAVKGKSFVPPVTDSQILTFTSFMMHVKRHMLVQIMAWKACSSPPGKTSCRWECNTGALMTGWLRI